MERLGVLFGSGARIKLMRHFLMNPEVKFTVNDLASRSKVSPSSTRREILVLKKAGLIKDTIVTMHGARGAVRKVKGAMMNPAFPYLRTLSDFILQPGTINKNELVKRFRQVGKVKLLVISGALTGNPESRVDMLIVGKEIGGRKLERAVRDVEADLGRELAYAAFDLEDFKYRMDMYDKLIADVLDYPHERLIDTLAVSTRRTVN